MGKTEKGALWLDENKVSPYEFYQYWRNIDDKDVKTVLCMLTFLPMEKINELTNVEGEKINEAKKVAAYEITKLVHGEKAAKEAEESSNSLFGSGTNTENMPSCDVEDGCTILDAIISAGFAPSKGQARTLVAQGGISINDEKISDVNYKVAKTNFGGDVILKKGKKGFCKLIIK